MTRARRALGTLGATVLFAFALTACGGDGDQPEDTANATGSAAVATPTATATTPTTPAAPAAELKYVGGLSLSNQALAGTLEIRYGDLVKATPGMNNGGVVLGNTCKIGAQVDAVVPYSIRFTSTTASSLPVKFLVQWKLARGGVTGDPQLTRVRVDQEYTVGGTQSCIDEVKGVYLAAQKTMNQGDQMTTYGFVVLHNYFSPNYPAGDTESVKDAALGAIWVRANDASHLGAANPTGNMVKVVKRTGFATGYGVPLVPSLASQNCSLPGVSPC